MAQYTVIKMRKSDLVSMGPRTISSPKIFVAYRFNHERSKKFRQDLDIEIKKTDSLGDIEIIDGNVTPGRHWDSEIRKRLTSSKIIIADVTGLSPEVLFECGFAWGLNKRIMPVVENANLSSKLPRWLTDLQIGCFSNSIGMVQIIDSISDYVGKSISVRSRKGILKPIPWKVVWLHGEGEFEQYHDNLIQTANRFGLELPEEELPHSLDDAEESLIDDISRSSLMIASLNNSTSDPFVHFATGVFAAKPTTGASSQKLNRRTILAIPDTIRDRDIVSDSAMRCSTIVKVVSFKELNNEFLKFGKNYQRYIKRTSEHIEN